MGKLSESEKKWESCPSLAKDSFPSAWGADSDTIRIGGSRRTKP